jgi:hypothetical protein
MLSFDVDQTTTAEPQVHLMDFAQQLASLVVITEIGSQLEYADYREPMAALQDCSLLCFQRQSKVGTPHHNIMT